jgi:hypothetical protein
VFLTGRTLESLEEVAEEIAPSRTTMREWTRRGEPVSSKLVCSACCTEDVLIANEAWGWAPSPEVEFHV